MLYGNRFLRVILSHKFRIAFYFSQVRDNFEHCNRLCIVFEKLGPSVYDVLLLNKREPLPLKFVRDLGRQLLESVELFHRFRVIHTDLKPDNILFVSQEYVKQPGSESAKGLLPGRIPFIYLLPKSSAIKVIDFGHAVREEDACDRIVSARCYRAPEVILGLGWSFPCDIWSVGCILVELFLGIPIFSTEDDMEHLARMEAYLGQFPRQMLDRIKPTNDKKYVKNGVLNWPEGAKSSNCVERVSRLPELQSENFLRFYCDSDEFVSFVLDLLTLDPSNRPTAREALEHPFFLTRD
ncbi:dual-specificity kinase [Ranunculus cassubicifolius]